MPHTGGHNMNPYNAPTSLISAQKRYLYGAIISCLYQKENNDPCLDAHLQSIINQISGSIKLFNQPETLTIIACLENARINDAQFRKSILDAANLVNVLKDGDTDA